MSEPVQLPIEKWNREGIIYHAFTCSKCGEATRNTYTEPSRSQMLERRVCFTCNHWFNFALDLEANHARKTIIGGCIYGPGSRTSGSFRGMAGRRFDIEYIEPSVHAGKRITSFDLWSGGEMPADLRSRFADTAKFLNGAERVDLDGEIQTCWEPSFNKTPPYPLPRSLGI